MNLFTMAIDPKGIWGIATSIGLCLLTLKWVFKDLPRIPLIVRCLWAYVICYCLILLQYPYPFFNGYSVLFQATAGQTLAFVLLLPMGVVSIDQSKPFEIFAGLSTIYSLLCIWMGWSGLFNAGSFNAAYAALCIPLLPIWTIILTVITIVIHHNGTALMIALTQASFFLAFKFGKKKFLPLLPLALAVVFPFRYGWDLSNFMSPDERLAHWITYLKLWSSSPSWVILGIGPGSFLYTSLLVNKNPNNIFFYMHNDWIQILFEYGVIGFALTVSSFGWALHKAKDRPRVISGIVGAAVFGMTYSPLRFFPSAVIVCYFFLECFITE